jgi:hypothetical protein
MSLATDAGAIEIGNLITIGFSSTPIAFMFFIEVSKVFPCKILIGCGA